MRTQLMTNQKRELNSLYKGQCIVFSNTVYQRYTNNVDIDVIYCCNVNMRDILFP